MQDIHSMGAGRLFTGGGGGDRRLRPHQHQNHQVLKCPRCDSLNTKFCYYNNYNLSQPRHFCKSCRRYWTKGGVLRNVPVGGGCRKTKRSKPKPSSERERTKSNSHSHSRSHSSSESSSLTATTTAAVTPTTTTTTTTTVEAVSAHSSNLLKMNNNNNNSNNSNDDSKYFEHVNPNNSTSFEHSLIEQGADCGIFSEIGSFTSLITSTNETLSFGFNNIMNHHHHHHHQQGLEQNQQWQQQQQKMVSMGSGGEELKMQEILDQTLQVELSALQNRSGNGGFGSLDWQGSGGDQGLFDLPNAVDQSYWSQSQWSDQDHPTLYLP